MQGVLSITYRKLTINISWYIINNFYHLNSSDGQETPVEWWENQHTVWGEIRDDESLQIVNSVYQLPIDIQRTIKTGMKMLQEEIQFSL